MLHRSIATRLSGSRHTKTLLPQWACRLNSTEAPSRTGEEGQLRKPRTVPRAESFGDLLITNHPSRTMSRKSRSSGHTASAPLSTRLTQRQNNNGAPSPANMKNFAAAIAASQSSSEATLVVPNNSRKSASNSPPPHKRKPQGQTNSKPAGKHGSTPSSSRPTSQASRTRSQSKPRVGGPRKTDRRREIEALDLSLSATQIPARSPDELSGPHVQGVNVGKLFEQPVRFQPSRTHIKRAAATTSSQAATENPPLEMSTHEQTVLEHAAGEYSRYHPVLVGRIQTDTLHTLGPVAFAGLTLSHRADVGLGMRKNAVTTIGRLVGGEAGRNVAQV